MYAKVKRLRHHGKHLSDRDISTQIPLEGDLSMHGQQWTWERVMILRRKDDQVGAPLAELYNPQITGMGNTRMSFRGEERPQGQDGPSFVQEWSVEIGRN